MTKRTLTALLLAGCAVVATAGPRQLGAASPEDPARVPGQQCTPALDTTTARARAESPPNVGAFIDCLRSSGYGER